MQITVNIGTCMDCRHKDHSGAFTPGGAKAICGHDYAPEGPKNDKENRYHWKYRVIENWPKIPEWCPLKKGYNY